MSQTNNTHKQYLLPLILVTSLFFLWGLAHNLNPILIPHLRKAFQLTDMQSALVDSSFFIAYFIMAIPAGLIMKRTGYKTGIIIGLCLFAIGTFLFYPAATILSYELFLGALFVIACGLTFLETAANPYVTILGDEAKATQRLNFSQSFNGLGATLAAYLGGLFILSGNVINAESTQGLTPEQLHEALATEASSVRIPYLIIGSIVLLVAVFIAMVKLPDLKETGEAGKFSLGRLFRYPNLRAGIIAQFFYVGAQVCVGSFFIRFLGHTATIDEKTAATYLSIALLLFMIGRFVGTFLMQFVAPARLLIIYSVANIILLAAAVSLKGYGAVYALMGVEFFMSIMFPTIFALSIKNLGPDTKTGSSLIIMSIVGGAVIPLLMGRLSDSSNIQLAYLVPLACFVVVLGFGWRSHRLHS